VTTTPPPPPPPGWYPDPSTGGERYWDGSAWATLTAPPEEPLPVPDLPNFDYKDSPKELIQRWGGFVVIMVLGCVLFALGDFLKIDFLQYGLPVGVIGGAWWAVRDMKKPVEPADLLTTPQSDAARQRVFQEYLSRYIAATQGRVESETAYSAVVIQGEKVNHILHLLISAFTCGAWLPVWGYLAMTGGEERTVIEVDQCGNVSTSD
jgi:hypothetical protein